MYWIIGVALIQAIICAVMCNNLAKAKGIFNGGYAFLGFFFSFLGLIYVAGLPALPAHGIVLSEATGIASPVPNTPISNSENSGHTASAVINNRGSEITCMKCGAAQKPSNDVCIKCGAEFIKPFIN